MFPFSVFRSIPADVEPLFKPFQLFVFDPGVFLPISVYLDALLDHDAYIRHLLGNVVQIHKAISKEIESRKEEALRTLDTKCTK